jgi:hypothetical protein
VRKKNKENKFKKKEKKEGENSYTLKNRVNRSLPPTK